MQQEETIWKDHPSQVTNMGTFILCGLLFFLIIPIFIAIWKAMVTKNIVYELTTERLRTREGVFSRSIDEFEIYRIRDYRIEQPFFLRMFGLSNVHLTTSDRSHPTFTLRAIKNGEAVTNMIRENVERMRQKKNVREVDFE